jgi:hypothetical protein
MNFFFKEGEIGCENLDRNLIPGSDNHRKHLVGYAPYRMDTFRQFKS